VSHATVFLILRDCHTFAFGAGVCLSHVVNAVLKVR